MGVTVAQILRSAARRHAARTAITDLGAPGDAARHVTFQDLDARAARIAGALCAEGVRPGDRVGLVAYNSAELVAAWFGIVYAGGTVVALPTASPAREIAERLRFTSARLVLADAVCARAAEDAARAANATSRTLDTLDADGSFEPVDTAPGDVALVLFTSGTAEQPRAATISHASLVVHTSGLLRESLSLDHDDHVLGVLPLAHSYGARMIMLASLLAGARVVMLPRFDAARSFHALATESITWTAVVPTMLAAWCALAPDAPPSTLRWCLSAGAPLPDALAHAAESRLGCEVRQGYGLTEASFATIDAPPDARIIGSVGRPSWGVEIRIAPIVDGGHEPGVGEVCVRGPNVMNGYLDAPEATRAALRDGWIHSGDLGRIDADGRLFVIDRIKDMIIRGGHNVYPADIERVLASHADVAHVTVFGRPDPRLGEEVVAAIVPRAGATIDLDALDAWSRERIASTRVPREVLLLDALPTGASGKVLRRVLRERIASGALVPTRLRARRGS